MVGFDSPTTRIIAPLKGASESKDLTVPEIDLADANAVIAALAVIAARASLYIDFMCIVWFVSERNRLYALVYTRLLRT